MPASTRRVLSRFACVSPDGTPRGRSGRSSRRSSSHRCAQQSGATQGMCVAQAAQLVPQPFRTPLDSVSTLPFTLLLGPLPSRPRLTTRVLVSFFELHLRTSLHCLTTSTTCVKRGIDERSKLAHKLRVAAQVAVKVDALGPEARRHAHRSGVAPPPPLPAVIATSKQATSRSGHGIQCLVQCCSCTCICI